MDLIVFGLVLEHIKDLMFIFNNVGETLSKGGFVYVGELHPFKQYTGSKARFEIESGVQVLECYTHHFSDYIFAANSVGLRLIACKDFFDDDNRNTIPRILGLLFQKID